MGCSARARPRLSVSFRPAQILLQAHALEMCIRDRDKDVAKVSIVGAGMQSHSGVASRMFEALFEANINIRMISCLLYTSRCV